MSRDPDEIACDHLLTLVKKRFDSISQQYCNLHFHVSNNAMINASTMKSYASCIQSLSVVGRSECMSFLKVASERDNCKLYGQLPPSTLRDGVIRVWLEYYPSRPQNPHWVSLICEWLAQVDIPLEQHVSSLLLLRKGFEESRALSSQNFDGNGALDLKNVNSPNSAVNQLKNQPTHSEDTFIMFVVTAFIETLCIREGACSSALALAICVIPPSKLNQAIKTLFGPGGLLNSAQENIDKDFDEKSDISNSEQIKLKSSKSLTIWCALLSWLPNRPLRIPADVITLLDFPFSDDGSGDDDNDDEEEDIESMSEEEKIRHHEEKQKRSNIKLEKKFKSHMEKITETLMSSVFSNIVLSADSHHHSNSNHGLSAIPAVAIAQYNLAINLFRLTAAVASQPLLAHQTLRVLVHIALEALDMSPFVALSLHTLEPLLANIEKQWAIYSIPLPSEVHRALRGLQSLVKERPWEVLHESYFSRTNAANSPFSANTLTSGSPRKQLVDNAHALLDRILVAHGEAPQARLQDRLLGNQAPVFEKEKRDAILRQRSILLLDELHARLDRKVRRAERKARHYGAYATIMRKVQHDWESRRKDDPLSLPKSPIPASPKFGKRKEEKDEQEASDSSFSSESYLDDERYYSVCGDEIAVMEDIASVVTPPPIKKKKDDKNNKDLYSDWWIVDRKPDESSASLHSLRDRENLFDSADENTLLNKDVNKSEQNSNSISKIPNPSHYASRASPNLKKTAPSNLISILSLLSPATINSNSPLNLDTLASILHVAPSNSKKESKNNIEHSRTRLHHVESGVQTEIITTSSNAPQWLCLPESGDSAATAAVNSDSNSPYDALMQQVLSARAAQVQQARDEAQWRHQSQMHQLAVFQEQESARLALEAKNRQIAIEEGMKAKPLMIPGEDWTDAGSVVAEMYKSITKPSSPEVGLRNLGNTCYFNSIMQSLFLTDSFVSNLQLFKPKKKKNSSNVFDEAVCLPLVSALKQLHAQMLITKRSSIDPNFVLSEMPEMFQGRDQQDATEALRVILDALGGHRQSLVRTVFGGMLASVVKCLKCGSESRRNEVFSDLSFSVPSEKYVESQLEKSGERPSVQDLINNYAKKESLTGDNAYMCENCGKKRSAEKWMEVTSPPVHLLVVLNCFGWNLNTGERSKLKSILNINNSIEVPGHDCSHTYELYAAVIHAGASTNSGHYFCIGRRSEGDKGKKGWKLLDDSLISTPDNAAKGGSKLISDIMQEGDSRPYVLLYRCREAPPATSKFKVAPQIFKKAEEREIEAVETDM